MGAECVFRTPPSPWALLLQVGPQSVSPARHPAPPNKSISLTDTGNSKLARQLGCTCPGSGGETQGLPAPEHVEEKDRTEPQLDTSHSGGLVGVLGSLPTGHLVTCDRAVIDHVGTVRAALSTDLPV